MNDWTVWYSKMAKMISWTWYGRVWNVKTSERGLTASESQVGGGGIGSIIFAKQRAS